MSNVAEVRERLRDAILRGVYAPNQRLIEAELAEQYDASRFVLRNALLQLASDGLVELQPNRGARVRAISVDEAIEITEIRRALEGSVAARAAERIDDDEITGLRQLGERMRAAVAEHELLEYSELNATLHSRIREIARQPKATRIIEQLNAQMVRHQFMLSLVPGRSDTSLSEHLAILEAICERSPDTAERAMREHITMVMNELAEFRNAPERAGNPLGMPPHQRDS